LSAVSCGDGSVTERVMAWLGKVLVLFFDHGDGSVERSRW
jgi:hypothetical protein